MLINAGILASVGDEFEKKKTIFGNE